MKKIAIAILITIGILWVINVMACSDYREPREVVLDAEVLVSEPWQWSDLAPKEEGIYKCERCWGYIRDWTWLMVHNCRNTSNLRDSFGQLKPEMLAGPEGYNPEYFGDYIYSNETPRITAEELATYEKN